MSELTSEHIVSQSKVALKQWGAQWAKHCVEHKAKHPEFVTKDLSDFENSGVGRALLLIANGYSFETEVETIKKYQHCVDIMVCDKSLGSALEHGIRPQFCLVADANVSYEKYLEPWKDRLGDVILFQNICGNPLWTSHGNWKDKYFYVNVDAIKSEKTWIELTGCKNKIPAGTNVSNAMVIFATQSNNEGRKNFMGYDKILLVGFDYCWTPEGNYYAFNKEGGGKHQYMRHQFVRHLGGQLAYSSNNLIFSAKWLDKYISNFNLPVVQCGKSSILPAQKQAALAEQMQYSFKREDSFKVRHLIKLRSEAISKIKELDANLKHIGREHLYAVMGSY